MNDLPVPIEERPIWELALLSGVLALLAAMFWYLNGSDYLCRSKSGRARRWLLQSHAIGLGLIVLYLWITARITGSPTTSTRWIVLSIGPYLVLSAQVGTLIALRASRKRSRVPYDLE